MKKRKLNLNWFSIGETTYGDNLSFTSSVRPLPQALIDWYKTLGVNILNGYGMTENCCVCSYLDTINLEGKGSVGIPWDAVDIKIGEQGEIWTKSPYLLKEYYKKNTKNIAWFFNEGNDLANLEAELSNKILSKYLYDDTFTQNLKNNQNMMHIKYL